MKDAYILLYESVKFVYRSSTYPMGGLMICRSPDDTYCVHAYRWLSQVWLLLRVYSAIMICM